VRQKVQRTTTTTSRLSRTKKKNVAEMARRIVCFGFPLYKHIKSNFSLKTKEFMSYCSYKTESVSAYDLKVLLKFYSLSCEVSICSFFFGFLKSNHCFCSQSIAKK